MASVPKDLDFALDELPGHALHEVLRALRSRSPVPTHLNVGGIASPTATRVFLATADDSFDDGGALFESADGGATWVQRDVPFSLGSGLSGIFFLDDQNGWTCSGAAEICGT